MTHDNKHSTDNAITNDVSDSKASATINERRNSLKKMAIGTTVLGGATASQWSQPIINSVISPAHAQATASSCSGSQTFDSPGEFEFIVPDCVSQVSVEVSGGAGGKSFFHPTISSVGGLSTGTITVTGGSILTIIVGAEGSSSPDFGVVAIGFGNGGSSGHVTAANGSGEIFADGGGGGGSAVLQNGTPIVVGGGGGGTGSEGQQPGDGNGGNSGPPLVAVGGRDGIGGDGNAGFAGNVGTGNFGGGDGSNGFSGGGGGYGGGGTGDINSSAGGGGLAGPGGTANEGGGSSGDGFVIINW